MFGGVGKALNSLTGASASASKAHQSSVSLANLSYAQQKQFAQNAHQWEMQDLEKAGLNPALTASGSSAGSIAGGGSTGGSGAGNVGGLDILNSLSNMMNTTKATNAKANLDNAQAMSIIEMLPFEKDIKLQMMQKINTDSQMNLSNIDFNKRRASGKGWSVSTNAGPVHVGGSYNY